MSTNSVLSLRNAQRPRESPRLWIRVDGSETDRLHFFKASSFQSARSVYNSIHFFQLLPCGVDWFVSAERLAYTAEASEHSASSGRTTITYQASRERGHATRAEAGGGGDGSGFAIAKKNEEDRWVVKGERGEGRCGGYQARFHG